MRRPGNRDGRPDDPHAMRSACDTWREVLSAALDGEATAAEQRDARAHLAQCTACRSWYDDAAAVTRRARTGAVEPGPDLVDTALAHLPRPRPWLLRPPARRVALGAVGAAQVLLGLVALLGFSAHDVHAVHGIGDGASVMGAGLAHAAHESASWNLALGAAFVVGAWRPRHLAGLLPVLGVFLAVLAALSTADLLAGRVDAARVVAHVVVLLGFLLAVLVVRDGPRRGPAPTPRRPAAADEPVRVGPAPAGRARPESTPDVA